MQTSKGQILSSHDVRGQKLAKIEPTILDTTQLQPSERVECLNDLYGKEGIVIRPKGVSEKSLDLNFTCWELEYVFAIQNHSRGHLGQIGYSLNGFADQLLAIQIYIEGSNRIWLEDGYLEIKPGDIMISLNPTRKRVYAVNELKSAGFRIPRDLLTFDTERFSVPKIFRAGTPETHLLSAAIDQWLCEISRTSRDGVTELERKILGSVNAILGVELEQSIEDPIIMNARTCAIRSYLDQQLRHGEVDIDFICRQFAASRATIYREFSNEGGLHRYVSRRRLLTAMFEIAGSENVRGRIMQVSEKYGYRDQFEFSRAFRREFDMAPSDVLKLPTDLRQSTNSSIK